MNRKHRWYKPDLGHRTGSRTCLACGVRRRIKRGTRLTWEYKIPDGVLWLPSVACRKRS